MLAFWAHTDDLKAIERALRMSHNDVPTSLPLPPHPRLKHCSVEDL